MGADSVNRSCAFDARLESILLADPPQNPFSTASIPERSSGRRLGRDIAASAWAVLNDEWLTEPLRQPLTDQACDDVNSGARGDRNDADTYKRNTVAADPKRKR